MKARWNWPTKRIRLGYFDISPFRGEPDKIWINNLDTHEGMETSQDEFFEVLVEAIEKYIAENT